MSGSNLPLDPNLTQVLEDLSNDSMARLFLVDPKRVLTGLRDGTLRAQPSRTGLRPVERHLLQVHRHEVAWLLREAYLSSAFYPGNRSGLLFQGRPREARDVRRAAERCLRGRTEAKGGTLSRFARPTTEQRYPSEVELLSASLTLQDAPNARVYLAYHLLQEGQPRAARRHAGALLETATSGHLRLCALECFAAAHNRSGDRAAAITAYRQAYSEAQAYGLPVLSIAEPLLHTIRIQVELGGDSDFLETVRALQGLELEVSQLQSAGERLNNLGLPILSPEAKGVVARHASSIGDEVMEFLNALV